jgi:hypothetical protein
MRSRPVSASTRAVRELRREAGRLVSAGTDEKRGRTDWRWVGRWPFGIGVPLHMSSTHRFHQATRIDSGVRWYHSRGIN